MSEQQPEQNPQEPAEGQDAAQAEQEAQAARKAEEEAAQALKDAEAADADRAELEALRAEKADWTREREELERKAKRVVPAPRTKTEKAAESTTAPEPTTDKPKKKARVSSRWFGDAAYDED